jgi:exodeoxyribonuclease-1
LSAYPKDKNHLMTVFISLFIIVQWVNQSLPRDWIEVDVRTDPDHMLYSGGFFSREDSDRIQQVRRSSPEQLKNLRLSFSDARLDEMLFRYRARNWPETLTLNEQSEWQTFRRKRLLDPQGGGSLTLDQFFQKISALRNEVDETKLSIQETTAIQHMVWIRMRLIRIF